MEREREKEGGGKNEMGRVDQEREEICVYLSGIVAILSPSHPTSPPPPPDDGIVHAT